MPLKAKLHFKSGERTGTIFPVEKHEIILGRDKHCDIVIDNVEVSRRHAQIRISKGQFYIKDLNSTNGTLINGRKINKPELLKNGDMLTIGDRDIIEVSLELEGDLPGTTDKSLISEEPEFDSGIDITPSHIEKPQILAETITEKLKKLPSWTLVLITASIFLILFCILPLFVIEITNQWCNLFSSFFNAINPGLCP